MMNNDRLMFKFYKSYFDIAQELDAKDRLAFYDALLNKQFLDIEPNLKGLAKFAYISQKHNIDKQIKGWKDKMNIPIIDPTIDPMQGGSIDPSIQLKEEVKSKYISPDKSEPIDFEKFIEFFNSFANRKFKLNQKLKATLKNRLESYTKKQIQDAIIIAHKDEYHKSTNYKYLTPEFILRVDKLERFLNTTSSLPRIQKIYLDQP